ncbi:stabilizer of axonemal microtubules 2-like [Octopus sinensis]|uniref:Stabilizer of axonemal microtubules 2-like n=1 Tax=Octopus sinensis TaxID=2607531 RepID=A0A6P7T9V0_9MOLL|nr:stabilizer of axonemal microtubules 2-like [Octopus sinensis]
MTLKCICNICTCGRHYCKHQDCTFIHPGAKTEPVTEYSARYTEHELGKVESFRPKHAPLPDGKMECKSIQREDFQPYQLEKKWVRPQEIWQKPPGTIDNLTSYNITYTGRQSAPVRPIRHDKLTLSVGKFEGEPTYRADYKKWDKIPSKKYGPVYSWSPPTQKLANESTFTRDFKYNYEPPRKSMRPEILSKIEPPLEDKTGYREDYVAHSLPPKVLKEKQTYNLPAVPLDCLTTSRHDYQGQSGPRTLSYKPKLTPVCAQEPFPDMTTFKQDFCEWPTEKRSIRQPTQYVKPPGKVEQNTVHKLTYKEFPVQHTTSYRPKTSHRPLGNIESNTSYNTDYKRFDVPPVRISKKESYAPPEVPFQGISTHQAHFIEHPRTQTKSFKPTSFQRTDEAPLDDSTMYRNEYTPKEVPVCPIIFLNTDKSLYEFEGNSKTGHQLYKPLSSLQSKRAQLVAA